MSDIVELLRYHGNHCLDRDREQSRTCLDAAEQIERLEVQCFNFEVENERLRSALKTIADHSDICSDFPHSLENIQTFARNAHR
jgi:hypothetical protein